MTKKHDYRNEHPEAYEQGHRARLSSIHQSEAPYDANTDALKAWQAGYDDAEGEAARNETSGPQDAPKAEDQTSTVASANKAK